MTGAAYNALRRIGARNPFNADFRGSFALIGYTGPGRPKFIKQVILNILRVHSSKCIKGLTHYLGNKQDFDVSSEGPSSNN